MPYSIAGTIVSAFRTLAPLMVPLKYIHERSGFLVERLPRTSLVHIFQLLAAFLTPGMVSNKGGKRNAAIAIDALRELFVTSLLPDSKLKYLTQRPELEALALQGKDGEPLLRFWYWEDTLKQR